MGTTTPSPLVVLMVILLSTMHDGVIIHGGTEVFTTADTTNTDLTPIDDNNVLFTDVSGAPDIKQMLSTGAAFAIPDIVLEHFPPSTTFSSERPIYDIVDTDSNPLVAMADLGQFGHVWFVEPTSSKVLETIGYNRSTLILTTLVAANLTGLDDEKRGPYQWHVHAIGVSTPMVGAQACTAAGPMYDPARVGPETIGSDNYTANCAKADEATAAIYCEVGDISNKVGDLPHQDLQGSYAVSNLPLQGANSIIGRSFVLHDQSGSRIACGPIRRVFSLPATLSKIESPLGGGAAVGAVATFAFSKEANERFEGLPEGTVHFTEGPSRTVVDLDLSNLLDKEGYLWHVHRELGENRSMAGTGCLQALGHFDPTSKGPALIGADKYKQLCNPDAGDRANNCEVGDLSSKVGNIDVSSAIDGSFQASMTVPYLPLQGQHSIVGQSLVIHRFDGSRLACAPIVAVVQDAPPAVNKSSVMEPLVEEPAIAIELPVNTGRVSQPPTQGTSNAANEASSPSQRSVSILVGGEVRSVGSVSSTISFPELDIQAFADAEFENTFKMQFQNMLAAAANVAPDHVVIASVTPGSINVAFTVYFSSTSKQVASKYAESFALILKDSADQILKLDGNNELVQYNPTVTWVSPNMVFMPSPGIYKPPNNLSDLTQEQIDAISTWLSRRYTLQQRSQAQPTSRRAGGTQRTAAPASNRGEDVPEDTATGRSSIPGLIPGPICDLCVAGIGSPELCVAISMCSIRVVPTSESVTASRATGGTPSTNVTIGPVCRACLGGTGNNVEWCQLLTVCPTGTIPTSAPIPTSARSAADGGPQGNLASLQPACNLCLAVTLNNAQFCVNLNMCLPDTDQATLANARAAAAVPNTTQGGQVASSTDSRSATENDTQSNLASLQPACNLCLALTLNSTQFCVNLNMCPPDTDRASLPNARAAAAVPNTTQGVQVASSTDNRSATENDTQSSDIASGARATQGALLPARSAVERGNLCYTSGALCDPQLTGSRSIAENFTAQRGSAISVAQPTGDAELAPIQATLDTSSRSAEDGGNQSNAPVITPQCNICLLGSQNNATFCVDVLNVCPEGTDEATLSYARAYLGTTDQVVLDNARAAAAYQSNRTAAAPNPTQGGQVQNIGNVASGARASSTNPLEGSATSRTASGTAAAGDMQTMQTDIP